ncbi:N-(5'-phosphoribosyl)anthranilate isomerase [Bacteroidia bacterium]|nr:N-(5'-phosphoribosyl)anthranilate isomerase [Bacteroidia bacterium]
MIIKVCGMKHPENIRQVAALGVDWIGFIFWPSSKRYVEQSGTDDTTMPRQSRFVGVFVNASAEEMLEKATEYSLDYLQLHGDESPDLCYTLQKRGKALIKAFSIATEEDVARTAEYEGRVDYFLFDTKYEGYGGSGKSFDWSVLSAYKGETPFLLSGGLSPESIEALRSFSHPRLAGIDLNSGFEIEPGLKDIEKLKEFISEIRNI